MNLSAQLSRIRQMEEHLDAAKQAVDDLSAALEGYAAVRAQIQALEDYYHSPQWLEDYDADRAGLLPPDLKRGVLSQDAVYDLLREHDRLLNVIKETFFYERDT